MNRPALYLLQLREKRFLFTRPRRGYTSWHSIPFPYRKQNATIKRAATTSTKCSLPSYMWIFDVGILAKAFTNLTCSTCKSHLTIYDFEYLKGWHTTFFIMCASSHQLIAEFPSSKPLGTDTTKLVNVELLASSISTLLGILLAGHL